MRRGDHVYVDDLPGTGLVHIVWDDYYTLTVAVACVNEPLSTRRCQVTDDPVTCLGCIAEAS